MYKLEYSIQQQYWHHADVDLPKPLESDEWFTVIEECDDESFDMIQIILEECFASPYSKEDVLRAAKATEKLNRRLSYEDEVISEDIEEIPW